MNWHSFLTSIFSQSVNFNIPELFSDRPFSDFDQEQTTDTMAAEGGSEPPPSPTSSAGGGSFSQSDKNKVGKDGLTPAERKLRKLHIAQEATLAMLQDDFPEVLEFANNMDDVATLLLQEYLTANVGLTKLRESRRKSRKLAATKKLEQLKKNLKNRSEAPVRLDDSDDDDVEEPALSLLLPEKKGKKRGRSRSRAEPEEDDKEDESSPPEPKKKKDE
jgi:hypothetical protein